MYTLRVCVQRDRVCVGILCFFTRSGKETRCAMARRYSDGSGDASSPPPPITSIVLLPPTIGQVEHARASGLPVITGYLTCFYCYFQEHFFYFQEAELRMDVLQQHAALMGGASTTSCPLCHKLFLGSESLVEHMKVHHNDPTTVSQAVVGECYFKKKFFFFLPV